MAIINCYVDDETLRILESASIETGRRIEELAEAAISNAAIDFKVSRNGRQEHNARHRNSPRAMP